MAGLRRKVALRTAALLLAVRWYNIAFLTVAQSVYIWKLVQYRPDAWTAYGSWGLTALVLAINAVLIAGGSLINNFYDTEHDLIHRPWRTLFERTVVLKYGIPLAFAFWIIGLGLAWGLGSRMGLFFAVYALLLWIYSHKRKTLGRGAHAVAAGLAFLPFLGCSLWLKTLPIPLLGYGLVMLLFETARQAAKTAQTDPSIRGYREAYTLLFAAAATAVVVGFFTQQPGFIMLGFPAGTASALMSRIQGTVSTQSARNLDTFLKVYMVFSLGVLVFLL